MAGLLLAEYPNVVVRVPIRNTISRESLEIFDKRVGYVGTVIVNDPRRSPFYIFHQSVKIVAGLRNADDADGGAIPQLRSIEFCDRNVETGAQTVFQAADDLSPVFDGLRRFDVEFEGEKSDHAEIRG
jgi:hypothetical protein